jgi:hypothetical protein
VIIDLQELPRAATAGGSSLRRAPRVIRFGGCIIALGNGSAESLVHAFRRDD